MFYSTKLESPSKSKLTNFIEGTPMKTIKSKIKTISLNGLIPVSPRRESGSTSRSANTNKEYKLHGNEKPPLSNSNGISTEPGTANSPSNKPLISDRSSLNFAASKRRINFSIETNFKKEEREAETNLSDREYIDSLDLESRPIEKLEKEKLQSKIHFSDVVEMAMTSSKKKKDAIIKKKPMKPPIAQIEKQKPPTTAELKKQRYMKKKSFYELSQDEKQMLREYEAEVLGIRRNNVKDLGKLSSFKSISGLDYINKFHEILGENEKREYLMKLVSNRKNTKRYLNKKSLKNSIEELTEALITAMEFDDVYLFLEILHLIADTYTYFSDQENSLFAFNQLRLACELVDNIPKKLEAYLGLAATLRKVGYYEWAHKILRRALQYSWNIDDKDFECKIYDLIGIYYYAEGKMEEAQFYHEKSLSSNLEPKNSPLIFVSNKYLNEYRKTHHQKLKTIELIFFSKLSIPIRLKHKKKLEEKEKNYQKGKVKLLLYEKNMLPEEDLDQEDKIQRTSLILDKMINKIKEKKSVQFNSLDPIAAISTTLNIPTQMEFILNDPDFDMIETSPRSFHRENPIYENEKPALSTFTHKKERMTLSIFRTIQQNKSNKPCPTSAQDDFLHTLKESLQKNDIGLKNLSDKLDLRLSQQELHVPFDDLKKQFKSQYISSPVKGKILLNHMTPNRMTSGFDKVFLPKTTRYDNFYKKAVEHVIQRPNTQGDFDT